MSDATRLLSAIEQGDPIAAEELLPLVYNELRRLAAQRLAREKTGRTLQATALVHEAYPRLVDGEMAQCWDSRGHFFAEAAEAMRRILVEAARRKRAEEHGGGESVACFQAASSRLVAAGWSGPPERLPTQGMDVDGVQARSATVRGSLLTSLGDIRWFTSGYEFGPPPAPVIIQGLGPSGGRLITQGYAQGSAPSLPPTAMIGISHGGSALVYPPA